MNFLKATVSATVMMAFAMSAQAQDKVGLYVNLGVQTLEFDTYSAVGRAGYNISRNFGLEVEGAVGFSGQEEDGVDITTPYSIGGYLVSRYPISSNFELLGRVGYANINFEAEDLGQSDDVNVDGFSTGGGIMYNLNENNGLRLDYTTLLANGGSANIFDVTYVRKF